MRIELQFLDLLQQVHTPLLDQVMCKITALGNAGVLWIALGVLLLLIPKTRKGGLMVLAALCVEAVLCNGILKPLVARTRPYDVNTLVQVIIAKPKDFSFPSGHTAAGFAAVTALYFAQLDKLWKFMLVVAVLIAFSRMYLYVHYPTDVLGGVIVGIISGCLGSQLVRRYPIAQNNE